jgi:hypothetical protein
VVHVLVIGRWSQEDHWFEATLGYIVRPSCLYHQSKINTYFYYQWSSQFSRIKEVLRLVWDNREPLVNPVNFYLPQPYSVFS